MSSDHEPSPTSPTPRRTPRSGLVLGGFVLLAVLMTWPLAARLVTHVPLGGHDVWQNCWNIWWWKTALWERGQSPYTTDMLYYPLTVPLGNHTHSPANMLLTMPVSILLGVPAALNLATFAGFVFAAHGAFLLAREYTRQPTAAVLAGVAFAYLPQHVEQALEHLNLASYQAMPYFLWALVRLVRSGGTKWWLATGIFFALNALLSWHNGLLVTPIAVAVLAVEGWRGPRRVRHVAVDLAKSAVLALALIGPFLWPLVRDSLGGVAVLQKETVDKPIAPLFLLVPHPGHPLWGDALAPVYSDFRTYPSVGFVGYLGAVTILLALSALLVSRPADRRSAAAGDAPAPASGPPRGTTLLWGLMALFFLLLSFGQSLQIAKGLEFESSLLPFSWLKSVPIFGLVRVPNRFLVPAALATAVLAARGAGAIATLLRPSLRQSFLVVAGLLMLLDLAWLPFPLQPAPRPDWIQALDSMPPNLAVLDIPSGHRARGVDDMYLQTLHGRPIASGYVSTRLRAVEEQVRKYPVLQRIFLRYPPESSYRGPGIAETARELGVGLVVVHLDRTVERLMAAREEVRREDPTAIYELRARNPEKGIETAALDRFRLDLGEAFGEPVFREEGTVEFYLVR